MSAEGTTKSRLHTDSPKSLALPTIVVVDDDSAARERAVAELTRRYGDDSRIVEHAWSLERAPFTYETSIPGVYAVGDVRHRSVKRVASAEGEGPVVVQQLHEYLRGVERVGVPVGVAPPSAPAAAQPSE